MVNYVFRVHHKTTLCCSNLILLSSLSLPKCLVILISPSPLPTVLVGLCCFVCVCVCVCVCACACVCVSAMYDCRPVLSRTLEIWFLISKKKKHLKLARQVAMYNLQSFPHTPRVCSGIYDASLQQHLRWSRWVLPVLPPLCLWSNQNKLQWQRPHLSHLLWT